MSLSQKRAGYAGLKAKKGIVTSKAMCKYQYKNVYTVCHCHTLFSIPSEFLMNDKVLNC